MTTRRTPTGAAVLQPDVTQAITEAVLDELAEVGYGRLSMEAVAKRAGVGKSALYRRWRSKHEMISAVVSEFSVSRAPEPDTGTLRGDLRESVQAVYDWLAHRGSPGSCRTSSLRASATRSRPTTCALASAALAATPRGRCSNAPSSAASFRPVWTWSWGSTCSRRRSTGVWWYAGSPRAPNFWTGSSSTCSAHSTPAPWTDYARSGSPATRSMRAPRRLRFSTKCG